MLHPSTKRLIDKLSDMTRRHRVAWTEGENAAVVHDTEGYRVVLTPEPHSVLLTDGMGREIESCLPDEFTDELDAQGRPYARFIAELYRDAHRHARGPEKAISTLLAGLEAVEEAAPIWPVPDLGGDAPDSTTDETALIESETAITAAVATLADQINGGAAPPAEAPEPEPASAPVMAEEIAPVEEPVNEPVALPEPETAPEPEIILAVTEIEATVPIAPEPEPEPEIVPSAIFAAQTPEASVEVEPLAEEPGSFGTFGDFFPSAASSANEAAVETQVAEAPAAEPAAEPLPVEAAAEHVEIAAMYAPPVTPERGVEPKPLQDLPAQTAAIREPLAEPKPATPTLAQPISLSSIPFGFGLGAAQRSGAPSHPATPPANVAPSPKPEMAAPTIIDGTLDLPEQDLMALDEAPGAEPFASQMPGTEFDDLPNERPTDVIDPSKPRRFNPWN